MPQPAAGHAMERTILDLLAERGPDKSICPSDAARRFAGEQGHPARWRQYMQAVRDAAARLAAAGKIIVTQRDQRVDIESVRGAIRLRLP